MSARQLIVLVIAAIAAIGALLLIRGMGSRDDGANEAEAAAIVGERVLVAARDIAQGASLTADDLAVATFPEETVAPAFVKLGAQPTAQAEYVGAITRRTFARGEPITATSIIQADDRGFLSAQLQPGYRAVAIEIEAITAVGGYIQPNDRVDVIVTVEVDTPNGEQVNSDVILEDIRVLALGDQTQPQASGDKPETIETDVAVLELTQEEARQLALADEAGKISLALRGVEAESGAPQARGGSSVRSSGAGAVRVHAFGSVSRGGQ